MRSALSAIILAAMGALLADGGSLRAGPYMDAVLADGPFAYYRLNEAGGATATNLGSVGAALDGTYNNASGFLFGQPSILPTGEDLSVMGDGATSGGGTEIRLPDDAALNTGDYDNKTVELWFQANSITTRSVLYEQGGDTRGINLYVEEVGGVDTLFMGAWNLAESDWPVTFVSAPIIENTPYHAVFILDGDPDGDDATDDGFVRGYLDGTLIGTTGGAGNLRSHGNNTAAMGINENVRYADGATQGNDANFAGFLDELALYNIKLDDPNDDGDLADSRVFAHFNAALTHEDLTWDGSNDTYGSSHWVGNNPPPPPDFPDQTINAIINSGTVTVAANREAFSLEVSGGSLIIGSGNTLTVASDTNVAAAASLTIENGGTLITPAGSLAGVTTHGNTTIDGGATASHVTMDGGATFTKAGPGTLSFDQSAGANVIDNTNTIQVTGGELRMQVAAGPNPIGGADLVLNGGTFTVQGASSFGNVLNVGRFDDGNYQQDFSANGGAYTDDASGIFSGQQLLSGTPEIEKQQTGPLSYANSNAFNNFFFGSDGNTDQWQAVWTGYYVAQNAGVHQFRIQNAGGGGIDDDGSLWIDDDQSGTFDADEGGTTGGQLAQTTNVALTPGQMVAVAFGFNENGGGESYRVQFMEPAGPYTSWTTVDPTAQAGYWQAQSVDAVVMTDTDVFVSADSTLNAITDATAAFGGLTFTADATLTTSGAHQGIGFVGTTFAGGVTAAGVNPETDTDLGIIDDGGVGITITKTGSGRLILNNGTANNLGTSSTFNVVEGPLVVVLDPDNPLRDAAVELGGGTLALSIATGTAGDGGTETFDKPLTVTGGNSILTAGQHANGLAGPKTVVVGSATNGFNLTGGNVTVTTTDGYSLEIPGPLTGGGGLIVDGPNVTIGAGGTIGRFGIYAGATGLVGKELVVATNRYDFTDVTIDYDLGTGADASAEVHIGNDDVTEAPVILNGTNAYSGMTQIRRGVLRADEGKGLPVGSLLNFNSNDNDQIAVLETSGTFTRNIGNNPGEVYWQDRGGFAARGGDLIVSLEGGADLIWGDGDLGFNGQEAIQFGSASADGMVELTNNIDLGNAHRRIQVADNPNVNTDFVRLSGDITSSGADNGDQFGFNEGGANAFRGGLIELTGTNTYGNRTRIDDVTVFAIEGVGLPTNSGIRFEGNANGREAIFMSNGTMQRDIGNNAGEVSWDTDRGGFAARGGPFTVTLTTPSAGAGNVNWNGNDGFDGRRVQWGSQYADDVVTFTSNVDGGDGNRELQLFDNPDTSADYTVWTGNVTNVQRLRTYGDGTIVFEGDVTLNNGDGDRLEARGNTIQVHNGVLTIPSNTDGAAGDIDLYDSGQVFINNVANIADDVIFDGSADDAGDNASFGGSGQVNLLNPGNIIEFGANTHARPGDRGVGTLTAELNAGEWEMESNSIYEWEVAEGSSDLVALTSSVPGSLLDLRNNWQLDMINRGISSPINATDQLDLFTYDDNVTLQLHGTDQVGSGDVTNFVLAGLPAYWDASGLEIKFEPAPGGGNHVFVTGLSAPPALIWDEADANWSEVVAGDSHWEGGPTPADLPTPAHVAVVNAGKATVANPGQQAMILAINGGEVAVASGGVLDISQAVDVAPAGAFSVAGGGTLNAPTVNTGGTTTFQAGAVGTVDILNVTGGTTSLSSSLAHTVNVSVGALNTPGPATVANLNVSGGSVNTQGNNLTITQGMRLGDTSYTISGSGSPTFMASGADLANQPDRLTLTGGVLTVTGPPVVPANPAAYWSFDDSADAGLDNSGNGHDGTVQGATWVPGGAIGGALSFDSTDDFVSIDGYKGITGTDPRSMSAWIRTTNNGNHSIMSWGTNSNGQKWNFRVQNSNGPIDGNLRVEVNGGYIVGDTILSDDQWHHVVATWEDDGSPDVLDVNLYVDGVPQNTSASQSNVINTASGRDVYLGRDHSNRYFDGTADEVFIFDRVLSPDEIQVLYDAGVAGAYRGGPLDLGTTDFSVLGSTTLALDTIGTAALGDLELDLANFAPGDTLLDISSDATSIDFADLVLDGPAAAGDYTLLNWLDKPAGSTAFSDAMFDNVVFNGLTGTLSFTDSTVSLNVAGGGQVIPEPSTFALAALGLLGLGFIQWRRRRGRC